MGGFRKRTEAFTAAVGPRRYIIVPLLAAVVGFVDWVVGRLAEVGMGQLIGVPSWVVGIFAALLLVTWWLLEYIVKLRRQISDARVKIAKLRDKGVRLRNDALAGIVDEASWRSWQRKALAWNKQVIREIREISEADAVWFSVLDVVPQPRLNPYQAPSGETRNAFFKLYREHDFRLRRLDKMIRDLWGRK